MAGLDRKTAVVRGPRLPWARGSIRGHTLHRRGKSVLAGERGFFREDPGHEHPVLCLIHQFDPVPASRLRLIERLIGELQCAPGVSFLERLYDGDAHADRHPGGSSRPAVLDIQCLHCAAHPIGDIRRLIPIHPVLDRKSVV